MADESETRQAIIVPLPSKRAFKLKAAQLSVKKKRTITQVELVDVVGRKVPMEALLPYLD